MIIKNLLFLGKILYVYMLESQFELKPVVLKELKTCNVFTVKAYIKY